MRNPVRFSLSLTAAVALCIGLAIPAATFAGGGPAQPTGTPKPDTQKRVWTNDDVERLNPDFVAVRASQTSTNSAAAVRVVGELPVRTTPKSAAPRMPLDPQQDPRWYAQQVTALDADLAAIDSREAELREFRATSGPLSAS